MVRYFSPKGIQNHWKMISELEEKISKLQKKVGEACSQSAETTHDNAPYEVLKNEISVLDARIREAYSLLNNVIIREYPKPNEISCVDYGTRVVFVRDGETLDFMIVGYGESNFEEGKILYECPLALALKGHRVGEKFKAEINKRLADIEIKEIYSIENKG